MASLYGIETEQDCRNEIDELLRAPALNGNANKETTAALKSCLADLHKQANSARGQRQMSEVERRYFWPAIEEAHANAPNVNSQRTWQEGLDEIELNLKYYRPKEG